MSQLIRYVLVILCFSSYSLTGQEIVINEFLSSNENGIQDEDGDFEDWIEIYNGGSQSINLLNYSLSDDETEPGKWTFPSVSLGPDDFLIVFASDKDRTGNELHTNFKIKASGEELVLSNTAGEIIDLIPSTALEEDQSFGRKPDGDEDFFFFDEPTPGEANTTDGVPSRITTPAFSMTPGFYDQSINLEINHESTVEIRYTTDGTEPTQNSTLYSGAIVLDQKNTENIVSEIPTNPSFDYPKGDYSEVRANTRGWLPPSEQVNKAHVIKVKAFDGQRQSSTITGTFFIDTNGSMNYTLPVISIVTELENFFSDDIGIYVYGDHPEGNYTQKGSDWERPSNFEYFENGSLSLSQGITSRIHGGGSAHSAQKNIRMYADGDNGPENFDYAFFQDYELDVFRRLIIKGGGQRPDCLPRDQIAGEVVRHLGLSVQAHQEVILFVNGEYWGLHGLKERYDDHYLQNKYRIDRDDVVILELSGSVDEGEDEDEEHYDNLLRLVSEEDITDPVIYNEVETIMDIDNYIDYQIAEIFMGNGDWPNGNIRFWRKRTEYTPGAPFGHDGRYRWMFYDLDNGFGGSCNTVTPLFNTMRHATSTEPHLASYTLLLRSLLNNEEFKNKFINRFTDLLNTIYTYERVDEIITQIEEGLAGEIFEHIKRWRYPSMANTLADRANETPSEDKYDILIQGLHDYAKNRPRKQKDHLIDYFQLSDSVLLSADVNDMQMGSIKINSIFLNPEEEGVNEQTYPWSGYYFKEQGISISAMPNPGFRFVEWSGIESESEQLEVELSTDSSFSAVFEAIPNFSFDKQVFINEVMADNERTIEDVTGEFVDWVELYNPSDAEINLSGYYITDNVDDPTKYKFVANGNKAIIPPKGFLIIWTDGEEWKGDLHTNFSLSKSGEFIGLYAPDGQTLVDGFEFEEMDEDISFGRSPDGSAELVFFTETTPGSANPLVTSISHNPVNETLKAFPNPSNEGIFYFNKRISGKVIDISGQTIETINYKNYWRYNGLSKGIYIIRSERFGSVKVIVSSN